MSTAEVVLGTDPLPFGRGFARRVRGPCLFPGVGEERHADYTDGFLTPSVRASRGTPTIDLDCVWHATNRQSALQPLVQLLAQVSEASGSM